MDSSSKPVLYKAWFCGFAQRAYLAMLANGVDFEVKEQNPYDKTPEWLAINPKGLVPALIHKGKLISESGILVEYVDEAFPDGYRLLPTDPYERARLRMIADGINKKFIPLFYNTMNACHFNDDSKDQYKHDVIQSLDDIVSEMDPNGPFFSGSAINYLDIMLFPHCHQFINTAKDLCDLDIKSEQNPRLFKWLDAMMDVKYVKQTVVDKEKLGDKFKEVLEMKKKSRK